MSAASLSGAALMTAQTQFEAALPSMAEIVRYHSRTWPPRGRDEMVANCLAALWAAWHSLARRGKDPVQVGVTGIAARCCLYTRAGRKIGNTSSGRGCLDVLDRRARRRLGLTIVSLDGPAEGEPGPGSGGWRLWLAQDNRTTPAAEAAFRVDFGRWLDLLPARKRQMAELLAEGHETGAVARLLDVTPAAVSQSRTWLEASWRAFQGGDDPRRNSSPARLKGHTPSRALTSPVEVE